MNLRQVFFGLLVSSNLGFASNAALASGSEEVTYRISVQNVTAGNVLSPFLTFISNSDFQVVNIGAAASSGVAALAETGDRAVLTSELNASSKATVIAGAEGGPILPGDIRTLEITVPTRALLHGETLDLLAMIGRSNDSFIRLGALPLARVSGRVGSSIVLNARNYDAGSEENTGNVEDFGNGGHPVQAAEGKVSLDRGLNPRGNAPDLIAWGPTAAIVTITRIH